MVRRKVNLEMIVQVAMTQASLSSISELSLISVAKELGIKSPSLFNHVSGLDEIKQRVALRALTALHHKLQQAVHQKAGEAAVMALALAYRDWVKKNSGLYPALRGVDLVSQEELADVYYSIMKITVSVFDAANLSKEEQIHQGRALRALLHGWSELERAGSFALAKEIDWSFARMVADFSRGAFENA